MTDIKDPHATSHLANVEVIEPDFEHKVARILENVGSSLHEDVVALTSAVNKLTHELQAERQVSRGILKLLETFRVEVNGLSEKIDSRATQESVDSKASQGSLDDLRVDIKTINAKIDRILDR